MTLREHKELILSLIRDMADEHVIIDALIAFEKAVRADQQKMKCASCGQTLPLLYPCNEQGCPTRQLKETP